jgi:hypothetical protein
VKSVKKPERTIMETRKPSRVGEDEDGEGVEGRMKEEEDKEFVVLGADAGADPGAVAGGFGREQREGWEGKRRGDEGEWSE